MSPEFYTNGMYQMALLIVQGLLAAVGFVGAFMINRLTKTIERLDAKDSSLMATIMEHREDVLKHYARHEQLDGIKLEVIGRINRLENTLIEMLKK